MCARQPQETSGKAPHLHAVFVISLLAHTRKKPWACLTLGTSHCPLSLRKGTDGYRWKHICPLKALSSSQENTSNWRPPFPSEALGLRASHSVDSTASAPIDHAFVLLTNMNVRMLPFFPRQLPLPKTWRCFPKLVQTLVYIYVTLQPLQLGIPGPSGALSPTPGSIWCNSPLGIFCQSSCLEVRLLP